MAEIEVDVVFESNTNACEDFCPKIEFILFFLYLFLLQTELADEAVSVYLKKKFWFR